MKIVYLINILLIVSICCSKEVKAQELFKNKQNTSPVTNQNTVSDTSIIHFNWKSFKQNGKEFKHGAMYVPVKIQGIQKEFMMQFDLGLNVNVIYENPLKSILNQFPDLKSKITKGKDYEVFKTKITIDNYTSQVDSLFIYKNYGANKNFDNIIQIGSIGVNEIENKILIIDFKNKNLQIINALSDKEENNYEFIPLEYKQGKIFLPLNVSNNTYMYIFDTGASLMPITTIDKNFYNLVSSKSKKNRDTLFLNSWGKQAQFFGTNITTDINIAKYPVNIKDKNIYFTEEESILKTLNQVGAKGIIGNDFFINDIILVDLKARRFGIKKRNIP